MIFDRGLKAWFVRHVQSFLNTILIKTEKRQTSNDFADGSYLLFIIIFLNRQMGLAEQIVSGRNADSHAEHLTYNLLKAPIQALKCL